MDSPERAILSNLETFVAFARKRVGDPHLAGDLVQDSLLRALKAARKPSSEEQVVPWFYRILRRSIIDLYRRRSVQQRSLEALERELREDPTAADERLLCECFKRLLPGLRPQYRSLLEEIDLGEGTLEEAAKARGISVNNAAVRLHRARQSLRERMTRACGACSKHGCLDCSCSSSPAGAC